MTKTRFSPSVLFENQPIRRVYDEDTETWWFSVVDIVRVLTQQADATAARKYWNKLKQRLRDEGSELVTNCHQLKLTAEDGKQRFTDVANAETLLRLVQSVPSSKAEPIKLWLAKVGYERLREIADPALGLERTRENWRKLGRSEKWITQRMTGQETRNKLTDYWASHEVKQGQEFAILTNLIHEEWSGVSVKEHKDLKGLESQNLRDHMSEAELIFTALPSCPPVRSRRRKRRWDCPPTKRPQSRAAKSPGAPASNWKARPDARSSPARTICRRASRKRCSSLELRLRHL
jgi:prophage antirepressor-like protein